ncbi:MAG: Uma2 family endonuclease [Acetobacteraceae bacterium]|nr:Uma2 family endonuclease [Acetobacteraceae bacterium]
MVALPKLPDPAASVAVEDFLAWNPQDGNLWQLVDGQPQAMAPANRTHGAIQGELGRLLANHLYERGSLCSVIMTPGVIPRVNAGQNVRVLDLGVTCSGYDTEERVLEDPILLVEILSPSNQAETWANVWTYATMPSVREVLVVRSDAIGAQLLRRNKDGMWPDRPIFIEDGAELTLESLAFSVPLTVLYRTTRLSRF